MSKFVRLASGMAVGALVAVVAWYLFGEGQRPPVDPIAAVQLSPQDAPQADAPSATPEANPPPVTTEAPAKPGALPGVAEAPEEPEPQAEAEAAQVPTFDEVRRESDGMTVIAGTAAPGASVTIQMDGETVAAATADGSGKFATIVMLPPDGLGHVLTLLQGHSGQETASADQIILAPLDAVIVAQVAPGAMATLPDEATTGSATDPARVETTTDAATQSDAQSTASADPAPSETPAPSTATSESAGATAADVQPQAGQVSPEVAEVTATQPDAAEGEELGQTPSAIASDAQGAETQQLAEGAEMDPVATAPDVAATAPQDLPGAAISTTPSNPQPETAPAIAPVASVTQTPSALSAPQAPAASAVVTLQATAPQPAANTAPTPPETTEVAVLKATKDGVELLGTAPPEVMSTVALDTISYSDSGEVELAGRAQPETRNVQIYLDNNAVVSLTVDAQGRWRGKLPGVGQGVYQLRVDEVAEDGSVTSRVLTPFKREAPDVLAAAAAGQDGPLKKITVQKGDTLWAISRDRYGDGFLYVRVFKANEAQIRDPDLIYPGQVFDLPD